MEEKQVPQAGCVVQLKSGGQKMTAGGYIGHELRCYWFDSTGEYHRELIDPAALNVVEQDKPRN